MQPNDETIRERKIWKQPNNYHPILVCCWWWSLTFPSGAVIVESMSQGLCLGDSQRRVDSGNYTFMYCTCIFDLISLTIQFDRLCLWVLDILGKATELFPLEGGSQLLWRRLWRGSDLAEGLFICWWDPGLDLLFKFELVAPAKRYTIPDCTFCLIWCRSISCMHF